MSSSRPDDNPPLAPNTDPFARNTCSFPPYISYNAVEAMRFKTAP
jgi:hypothetical protein